jgi:hypothetical protein
MTEFTDPLFAIGDLGQLESASGGAIVLPDPTNGPTGSSMFFGGYGMFDNRYTFLKDLVTGYAGRVPGFIDNFTPIQVQQIPMAQSNSNLAALQSVVSGTNMTLVTSAAQGIAINIPIVPFTGVLNSLGTATTATNAPIVLDYGFGWCATTAASTLVTVSDSTLFPVGMPLCIAHVNTGTLATLTNVYSVVSSTVVSVTTAPVLTNSATPIGTGNAWGPSEFASSQSNSPYPIPTAALPMIAFGPGLFLDPRQTIARCISFTASASTASVATFVVSGWDVFWQPMTDSVTFSASGASLSVYTKKAFKAVSGITANFNDTTHSWSSGTSDMYGFTQKQDLFELTSLWWNGLSGGSVTGFTVPDFTSPASATTGDVRGTIQLGASGSLANGQAGGASNGTVSSGSVTATGSRLVIFGALSTWNQLNAKLTAPWWQMGRPQA